MQKTVRSGMTPEQFAQAVRAALAEGHGRAAVQAGSSQTVAAGQKALTFIQDLRDLEHNPMQIVTAWERWVFLRTQDLMADLTRRHRGAAAFAAAHAGGSLMQIARALEQANVAPSPGPHSAAISYLEALAAAV